jgi:hypothetical protein
MIAKTALCALVLLPALAAPAGAQDTTFVLVDRIAAVVGGSAIPYSRVEEELNVFRQQGGELPEDEAGLQEIRFEILRQSCANSSIRSSWSRRPSGTPLSG